MKLLLLVPLALSAALVACGKPVEKIKEVKNKVYDALDVGTPLGQPDDIRARQQQRYDQGWRQLQSFRAEMAARQAQQAQAARSLQFVTGVKESFKNLDANAINAAPINVPISGEVRGPSVLKAQVYLDRVHFSVGVIDGGWGKNSGVAVWWWQRAHGMEPTGEVDEATFRALADEAGYAPALMEYRVTADDLKGPFVTIPDDVYEKEKLSCLCYERVREELAEKFHAAEDFLEELNPGVKFSDLQAGNMIIVPNVRPPLTADQKDIAKVVISIVGNSFNAFDAAGHLIFHAPTTLGSTYDPSPDEGLQVVKIIPMPHFHYDPTLYHEVPDDRPDAHLKPGPNSPVGVVWIALSKPHYGVHGTNDPDSIGYASSHGCVRLTNWDAAEIEHRMSEGVPVDFRDTKRR